MAQSCEVYRNMRLFVKKSRNTDFYVGAKLTNSLGLF